MQLLIPVILILLALGLALLWLSQRQKKASGLPGGRVIYTDTQGWKPAEKPLFDPELGLAGRPDYLVQDGAQIIPVEVKSTRAPQEPFDSHIYQLAAYCRLVHKNFGVRPAYALLHYPGRTFAIDYTPALEKALIQVLDEMRAREHQRQVDCSHQSPARCRACGYRPECDQRLA
jgi:CRISPR-associated exonuclease Cas4